MKRFLLFISCAFSISGFAQNYVEGADLPATGTGPGFYADPGVTNIAGTLNAGDSSDHFQVYVTFGNWIDSVQYHVFNSASAGTISFGSSNVQSFPPHIGTFANGPTGPFPVGQGIYECTISANVTSNASWNIAFFADGLNGVAVIDASQRFSVYPNPASDVFFVHANLQAGEQGMLVVENMFGQEISAEKISSTENRTTISTASISSGVYCCKLIINGETLATEKIVVQH